MDSPEQLPKSAAKEPIQELKLQDDGKMEAYQQMVYHQPKQRFNLVVEVTDWKMLSKLITNLKQPFRWFELFEGGCIAAFIAFGIELAKLLFELLEHDKLNASIFLTWQFGWLLFSIAIGGALYLMERQQRHHNAEKIETVLLCAQSIQDKTGADLEKLIS